MKCYCRFIMLVVIAFLIGDRTTAEDQPRQLLTQILDDWRQRQQGIQSISVELSGSQFDPKGRWDNDYAYVAEPEGQKTLARLGHVPPIDTRSPFDSNLLVQFDKNWARKDINGKVMRHPEAIYAARHRIHFFDGEQIRVYQPRDDNADWMREGEVEVALQTSSFGQGMFFGGEDFPIFWGCGVVWIGTPDLKKLRFAVDERNYQFKGLGEIGGRPCVVLRSPNLSTGLDAFYQFWIDRSRGSSILRNQLVVNGRPAFQTDAEWQQVEKRWFPAKWTCTVYLGRLPDGSPRLATSYECKVEKIRFNPEVDRSDFDVRLKPKMVVYDVKENQAGVIASDGKTMLPVSAMKQVSRGRMLRTFAIWAVVAASILAAGWYFGRHWVRRWRQITTPIFERRNVCWVSIARRFLCDGHYLLVGSWHLRLQSLQYPTQVIPVQAARHKNAHMFQLNTPFDTRTLATDGTMRPLQARSCLRRFQQARISRGRHKIHPTRLRGIQRTWFGVAISCAKRAIMQVKWGRGIHLVSGPTKDPRHERFARARSRIPAGGENGFLK